jgi:hypothetical protein
MFCFCSMKSKLRNLLLALWIGGLCSLCAMVAPAVFAAAPSRHIAGQINGNLFHLQAWIGLGFALLVFGLSERGILGNQRGFVVAVAVSAATPMISDVLIQPVMHQAQLAGMTSRFIVLHGVAAALYLIAGLAGIVALWSANRQAG